MGFLKKIFGSHSDHELKRLYPLADKIDALSDEYAALTDEHPVFQVCGQRRWNVYDCNQSIQRLILCGNCRSTDQWRSSCTAVGME